MTFLSQPIPNLLGGVSQRPPMQRRANEGSEQTNAVASYQKGLHKRSHTSHIAELSEVSLGPTHVHGIDRAINNRYVVVFVDSDLKVFDNETGDEINVTFPDGKEYLNTSDPQFDIRAVTVDDVTVITNRTILAQKGTTQVAARAPEAIVFIRQADFGTFYSIFLDGVSVTYTTPVGTTPDIRPDIGTDNIAQSLKTLIEAVPSLDIFTVERFGSTLYLTKTNGAEFTLATKDGLADQGILAIKKQVQDFATLPAFSKDGFVVEVTGQPGEPFDNYFVTYDDLRKPKQAGVWRECAKPGSTNSIDAATAPHQLVFNGASNRGSSNGKPLAPSQYSAGVTTSSDGFAVSVGGSEDTDGVTDVSTVNGIVDHYWYTRLDALPTGDSVIPVTVGFDVAINASGGEAAKLFLAAYVSYNNGSTWTFVGESGLYVGRGTRLNQSFSFPVSGVAAAGGSGHADIKWQIHTRGKKDNGGAGLTFHSSDDPLPGVQYVSEPASYVQFDVEQVYPEGYNFLLTVDGTPFTYAANVDDTGLEVASGLAALIDANATYVSSQADGLVSIERADGSATPVAVYSTNFDEAKAMFDPEQDFSATDYTSQSIDNRTDGSTATITSSATHVINFSGGLSGGIDNLFQNGDLYALEVATDSFVFKQIDYAERGVGDDITNPFPSFIEKPINEVFFYKARLGFCSGNRVIFSQDGDITNFFRQSAKDVFDDDLIDVQDAHGNTADFHSAIQWNEGLYLIASNAQFRVTGSPLTPASCGLESVGRFECTPRVRPVVLGSSVLVCKEDRHAVRVWQFFFDNSGSLFTGTELTDDVSSYIKGVPLQLVGIQASGFAAILTDDDATALYVYNFKDNDQGRIVSAWGKWQFASTYLISGLATINEKLYIVHSDSTGGGG